MNPNLPLDLENQTAAELVAANLPELADFDIEAFNAQVDLSKDQVDVTSPMLLIAVNGLSKGFGARGGDLLSVVFVVVVPNQDQAVARQNGLRALIAIRNWMTRTRFTLETIRTHQLHPCFLGDLVATYVG